MDKFGREPDLGTLLVRFLTARSTWIALAHAAVVFICFFVMTRVAMVIALGPTADSNLLTIAVVVSASLILMGILSLSRAAIHEDIILVVIMYLGIYLLVLVGFASPRTTTPFPPEMNARFLAALAMSFFACGLVQSFAIQKRLVPTR
jgi:hypothetical protein